MQLSIGNRILEFPKYSKLLPAIEYIIVGASGENIIVQQTSNNKRYYIPRFSIENGDAFFSYAVYSR